MFILRKFHIVNCVYWLYFVKMFIYVCTRKMVPMLLDEKGIRCESCTIPVAVNFVMQSNKKPLFRWEGI